MTAAGLLLAALLQDPLRVIVETDAGGDPDDEQSLVRFLVYANEFDVAGIIANRPKARERENLNRERTGLGIVRALVEAYGECRPRLARHDPRYPSKEKLLAVTVSGTDDVEDGVNLVIAAVDERPVWFMNWGTDKGSAASCLKRALDRVLKERGPGGYAKFKSRVRLSSADEFGDHTSKIDPPFPIWVDTFRPEIDRKRWYHRFSAITAKAGGFDVERDVRTGHGPLGALYPTNTTHAQKEGDTMTFLYLVPTGLNDPERPGLGSWAGRYGPNETFAGKPYHWANQKDDWQGTTDRDNTLRRWAVHLQNDFRVRMEWCVKDEANHPPRVVVRGEKLRKVAAGERVELDASDSSDPDGGKLSFEWFPYPDPLPDLVLEGAATPRVSFKAPPSGTLQLVVQVTDDGVPPLTRYGRVDVSTGR